MGGSQIFSSSQQGGEEELDKKLFCLRRGGEGVRLKVILHDEGGKGGQAKHYFV